MMKYFVPKIPLALALIFLVTHSITTNGAENLPSNEPVVYSAEAVREDLAFLYETLQISSYDLFLKKQNEVLPWKKFNSNMAISVEYDLEY